MKWIPAGKDASPFAFKETNDKTLTLSEDGKPVYAFNHGVIECDTVPKSDGRRTRACYLHPVWGMGGEVLTDDFPRDHYHHHGIFWTWPHVRLGDKEFDLWMGVNMRHRFRRWLLRETGPVAAVLAFEDGWFVGDKQVVTERIWIRTFKSAPENRSFDVAITCIPDGEPVTLWGAEGKSYGGMTMRFAKRKKTVITVPAGRTKEDLKETKLPWADFTAEFPGVSGPSGATIMIPREHPAYPPTWLTRHYGVLCVGYPGPEPATFTKDKPLNLDYRVWIHGGAAPLDQLKDVYEGYLRSRECEVDGDPEKTSKVQTGGTEAGFTSLFDGRNFDGWEGNLDIFRIEDGAVVAGSMKKPVPRNEFLCTEKEYANFDLRLKFKLLGGPKANAGIQIRSRRMPKDSEHPHEMIGYQADMGDGWWGCLYDESRRRKVLTGPAKEERKKLVKEGEWNDYRILCEGRRIRLWINGVQTVDYTEEDESIEQKGLIGLQIHGGPPSEAWYKDVRIRVLP